MILLPGDLVVFQMPVKFPTSHGVPQHQYSPLEWVAIIVQSPVFHENKADIVRGLITVFNRPVLTEILCDQVKEIVSKKQRR